MKKKNKAKKVTGAKKLKELRLSRETLQPLTSSDHQKAVGGTCSNCSSPVGNTLCGGC